MGALRFSVVMRVAAGLEANRRGVAGALNYEVLQAKGGQTKASKRANVKNEKQYEALKEKGMSKERAARIPNSPGSSSRGGKRSGSGGNSKQGGPAAQHKAAGRKGRRAAAKS